MYRRNMSGKLKKVVMFIRLSILLLLSRPLSDILLTKLHTIVDVNESDKVLQTEMLFSDFFLSRR